MTDSAPTPAASIPAGWYPDYTGQPRLRWWDGTAWTEHLSQPTSSAAPSSAAPSQAAPVAQAPTSAPVPTVPAGTPTGNVFIWLIVLLPIVSTLLRLTVDYRAIGFDIVRDARDGMAQSPLMAAGGLSIVLSLIGWLIAAAIIVLAYFDTKRLKATGFERPFPWPWAFFALLTGIGVLVYVVGRSIVVQRRSGRGLAPLFVAIAVVLVGLIIGGVETGRMLAPFFDQMGSGSFINS